MQAILVAWGLINCKWIARNIDVRLCGMTIRSRRYKLSKFFLAGLFSFISFVSWSAFSATLYFDPVSGSDSGNGSRSNPYGSLESAMNSDLAIVAGDTLKLLSGFHGYVKLSGFDNETLVSIEGDVSGSTKLASLEINGSNKFRVQNLSISPYHDPVYNPVNNKINNILSISRSADIEILNNNIFTIDDISGWSAEDWNNRMSSGISVGSSNNKVIGNIVRNINFGITVGPNAHNVDVLRNQVLNFAGDGLRGLGDDGLFEYNLIANAFDVNGNHDDGFQSFTNNRNPRIVSRVTLRGNQFYYDLEHPNRDLISAFQGIGCFDGLFNDWLIENNLLYINHWHGITLLGANNTRIINNTLIDADSSDGRLRPWIKIAPLKASQGGQSGTGNVTRNNIAEMTNEGTGITEDHNLNPLELNLESVFLDFTNNDFRLKSDSLAINAGSNNLAPLIDIRGFNRIGGVDIGAYEFGATSSNGEPPIMAGPVGTNKQLSLPPILFLLDDE